MKTGFSAFQSNIKSFYGKPGTDWLNSLPQLVEQIAQKWQISDLKVVEDLSINYVLSGNQDSRPVILKIGFDKSEVEQEARASIYFNSNGCVHLLDQNLERGALLLEALVPGTTLKTYFPEHDKEAAHIACKVIQKLHSIQNPPQHKFPHLSDWLKVLDKELGLVQHYVKKAQELRNRLLQTTQNSILLHGDLHHSNILSHGSSWAAIDPKGIIGDPVYEANCFIRNPLPELVDYPNIGTIIDTRLNVFEYHLGFSRRRMLEWSYIQSIMSACWMIENNMDPKVNIILADILANLIKETL